MRWTYQTLILEDFLPRIVQSEVFKNLKEAETPNARAHHYALYTKDKRSNLPREFVVAAYRFGHSGVRQGYRLNGVTSDSFPSGTILDIFAGSDDAPDSPSLLGFKPLPKTHVIDDFGRFFTDKAPAPPVDDPAHPRVAGDSATDTSVQIQFAYKIDTNIVDPLGALPLNILPTSSAKGGILQEIGDAIDPLVLPPTQPVPALVPPPPDRPSLALLNLLRGNIYKVQSGQEIARVLRSKGMHDAKTLTPDQLSIRVNVKKDPLNTNEDNIYQFQPISDFAPGFEHDTPLWFYILAEAQVPIVDYYGINNDPPIPEDDLLNGVGARTQMGWVGGRIVSEVFYGLMDADTESFVNAAPTGWTPLLGGDRTPVFMNLINFIKENPVVTPPSPTTPPDSTPPSSGQAVVDTMVAQTTQTKPPTEA